MEKKGVKKMKLGSQGMEVSALGLGCMGMSQSYGAPKSDDHLISLIRHSVHLGIAFLDSADFYGPHSNEILLGKALRGGYREKVQLATKFGLRLVDRKVEVRGDAGYVRTACEASLRRLGVDYIDLYYQHRVDTSVPIEVTVGEMKKLVEEGKVKYIGLSEACSSTIRRAHAVHPLTAVQMEWPLWTRELEHEIVPTCRELGIGIVAYGPLGKGFFTGGIKLAATLLPGDYRKSVPRFQEGNVEENEALFEKVRAVAAEKGCTPSQLALAWVCARGGDVCPIPGTTRFENLEQNLEALAVVDRLTAEDAATLDSIAVAVKGERTAAHFTTWRDSYTPPFFG